MKNRNVTLYIDAANLILTARTFGLTYNIYWLLEYFKFRYKVNKCVYFTGRLEILKQDYKLLESQGVEIVFKEIYREDDNKVKANCDVEISHRITLDVEYNKVDKVILMSGDGDFYSLLKYAIKRDREVKLVGIHKKKTSRLYKSGMLFDLTYFTEIINEINLDIDTPKEITSLLKGESPVGPLVPTRLFLGTDSITPSFFLSNPKRVLFLGDSITFGFSAELDDRLDKTKRWTKLVEKYFSNNNLQTKFEFIEEGQSGRTISDDADIEGKNGLKAFTQALYSHLYLDYIFIMLGTNNLKKQFKKSSKEISEEFLKYQDVIDKFNKKWEVGDDEKFKIILIAPPKINEIIISKDWGYENSQEISNNLAKEYKIIAKKLSWDFLDASEIKVSNKDGIHLDEYGNEKLAEIVFNYLNKKN